MDRFRAAWRALFHPSPPDRLDGWAVVLMMGLRGLTWEQALKRRQGENLRRALAWARGEKDI